MLRQIFLAHPRLPVKPMQRSLGRNPDKVPVTFFVLRQNQQVVVVIPLRIRAVVIFFADVKLAAKNRLNALLLRRLKKMHGSIDVAVVRDGNRLLADARDPINKLLHVASAVKKRIIRMQMKMSKFRHGLPEFYSPGASIKTLPTSGKPGTKLNGSSPQLWCANDRKVVIGSQSPT